MPRIGYSLRYPILRQPTGGGDVQSFQGSYSGDQTPTLLPGRDNGLCHHVQGGFKLKIFSDANWGNNPDNGKLTSLYPIFLANAPNTFKVGLQKLRVQFTMEADFVTAALAMKEAVFCSNTMKELGFGTRFDSVSLYLDNTSALHVTKNRTYSPRVKHMVLRYFFVQELVR